MPPAHLQPPADQLQALAERCVQCGLCLPACPTYASDRQEAESPRGRIAIARAWALGSIATDATGDAHLDHCLGCRNCEAVCPAGVDYGQLLISARALQRQRRRPAWRQRWLERLTARTRTLAALLHAYRLAHRWLPAALRPLPCPPGPAMPPLPPASHAMTSPDTIGLFVGCVAGPYEVGLRSALARLCSAVGADLSIPAGQTCCGALHVHAGNAGAGRRLAATNRDAFSSTGTVLSLASGCHDAIGAALPADSRLRDAIEFVESRAGRLSWRACHRTIALHLPCTQRNASGSVPALRRLLARIPGLQVVELDGGMGCCGAAGTQMLTDPERARAYRKPLIEQLERSGADLLLSANLGCRLHLGNATQVPVLHPLEFLAGLLDSALTDTGSAGADAAAATTPSASTGAMATP
ncbi:(Fe-S)-binding protein [Montanilutibacter psychrotolerans]|uniref:Glycolate oxidase iron-sulfur subunit n=1 Tax=Montanilutibacter psychrotolerans TaxID=1327343 RepID=A0A3M8SSS8_9GAMM|nr:(Fe-S)-binding protein [Lysobacter psychrotolerans]RNF84378.1 (Fe-S)-binding protein [Lysobacter psychrotolerans]